MYLINEYKMIYKGSIMLVIHQALQGNLPNSGPHLLEHG